MHEQPPSIIQIHEPQCTHHYNTRYSIKKYGACAVIDPDTGKTLQYQQLIQNPKHKSIWTTLMSNDIGQLAQGNDNIKGTNTMFFLPQRNTYKPKERYHVCKNCCQLLTAKN